VGKTHHGRRVLEVNQMPSSKVTFAIGGTSCQVEGPDGMVDVAVQPQWVTDQTSDLTRISYRTTSTVLTTVKLNLNNMTKASWQALRSFFFTTAKGPENALSYTHTDGTTYSNCRFAMGTIEPKRMNNNEYSVVLTMDVPGFFDP
jgi:hypothetical protein